MNRSPVHLQGMPAALESTPQTQQFLTLTLGCESFALPVEHVQEVIEFGGMTTMPLMPGFVRGVINQHGTMVPIIDLSMYFGGKRIAIAKRTCIVIVETVQTGRLQPLGIIVDAVNEVLVVEDVLLESESAFNASIKAEFISGIFKQNEHFVMVLDILQISSLDALVGLVRLLDQLSW